MTTFDHAPRIIQGVLSASECADLRCLAPIVAHHGGDGHGEDEGGHHVHRKPHRQPWLVARLAPYVRPYLPSGIIDPMVKVYRLETGQAVAAHTDEDFLLGGRTATWSCLVYLNNDHVGGHTIFWSADPDLVPFELSGDMGDVIIFPHAMTHGSRPVRHGVRWVLKTDIAP